MKFDGQPGEMDNGIHYRHDHHNQEYFSDSVLIIAQEVSNKAGHGHKEGVFFPGLVFNSPTGGFLHGV
jgi:hypothetical protein